MKTRIPIKAAIILIARARERLVPPALLSVGALALALSINYASSILAFIGLGLTFWGAVLFYIRPQKYVKEDLLDKTALPSIATLNQMIKELGFKGKVIHLPPKYLRDMESNKIYVSAQEEIRLPSVEETQREENRIFLKDPEGVLLTSPGDELSKLFERTLGTNFMKVDARYVEQNLPRLLVDLEIAQNVEVRTENNSFIVKIEGSVYKNLCWETRKLSESGISLGCPLCSAIACALAKASGKPIVIEEDQVSEDGQAMNIRYRLLEDALEKTQ